MNNPGKQTAPPSVSSNGSLRRHILPVAAYAVITVAMTGPFVSLTNLGGSVLYHGDPGHVMWAISWVNHALLTQPQDLFAANIFYPSAGSLSFNDHVFGIALLVHPWFWFSEDPFVPYNILFLLSYFASAVGMYFLCLHHTKSQAAAFIGGVIFGFCFYRAHHFGHLALISTQWFPFVVLLFHKLRERFRWGLAILWVSLFVLGGGCDGVCSHGRMVAGGSCQYLWGYCWSSTLSVWRGMGRTSKCIINFLRKHR